MKEQELISLRNYHQKVYSLKKKGRKKRRYEIHAGHIHYKNKDKQFIKSDIRFHEQNNGSWVMNQHNYFFTAPEYADDVFDFYNGYKEANHNIKLRLPAAEHIKGIQDKEGNIVYQNALGKGIDFKAVLKRSGIQKVVVIHKNPGKDMMFDFELLLDEKSKHMELEEIKEKKKTEIKELDKEIELTGKIFKLGEKEKQSYVKQAFVWDNNKEVSKLEEVKITIFKKDGKIILRKFIPKEFFDEAIFPVYTDHPTDYYGDTADGRVMYCCSSNWAIVHDALTGTGLSSTSTTQHMGSVYQSSSKYAIIRAFFYFDTSTIPDEHEISLCNMHIFGHTIGGHDVCAQKGIQSDVLCLEDYDAFEGNEYVKLNWTVDTYNVFVFNEDGKSNVNKSGMTKVCVREHDHDYLDVPSGSGTYQSSCRYTEYAGTDYDPYLEVEASAPSGPVEEVPTYQATHKPFNFRLEIRKNKTFELLKVLAYEVKKVMWEYFRLGGYGRAQITLALSPEDMDDYVLPDYEIRLYLDTATQQNVLVYRGYIERYKTVIGIPDMVQFSAYGYSGQLNRKELIYEYEDMEISAIVKHILTNYVLPYTPITYDEEDIDTTDYACSMRFNTMPREALKTLAEIAGNYEWGVDENMKFFFKKSSSTFEHFLRLKLEASKFDKMYDYVGIINRIVIKGGNDLEVTVNNIESQDLYGIRSEIVSNSAIISIGTAQRYGSMLLANKASIFHRAKIQKIKNQVLFESSLPLGRVAIVKEPVAFAEHTKYNEDVYGNFKYGGVISYVINKIRYMLTSEGTTATLDLGEPRPDIAVNLERLKFELNQIRNL